MTVFRPDWIASRRLGRGHLNKGALKDIYPKLGGSIQIVGGWAGPSDFWGLC
jgi:hypothetical protein